MTNNNLKIIEEIEYKYLKLLNSALGNPTQLKKELESQNQLLEQFMNPIDRARLSLENSYIDAGAERVVYNCINKSNFFGTPNSAPIGGDLFFETKDEDFNRDILISIDCKTVRAETNIGDIKTLDIGLNQHSYKSTVEYKDGTVRLINPMLQPEYTLRNGNKYLIISYLVVILYNITPSVENPEKTEILMIGNFCFPNGLLESHYSSRPWAAGKSPLIKVSGNQILKNSNGEDYQTADKEIYSEILKKLGNLKRRDVEEEYKNRTGEYLKFINLKGRFNYQNIKHFELFDNTKKRFKIIFLNSDIPEKYKEKLSFFRENYSI